MELGARPEHLEHPRDDVDLHPLILEQPDHVERLLVRVVRKGDDHAIDPVLVDELPDLERRPEQLERRATVLHGASVVVDEADDVQPVAAVLPHLLGKELRDVARADDEDVLHVRGLASADHADEDAEEPHEPDGERPEDDQPLEGRVCELDHMRANEEDPCADRDHLEDAEEVVDRRVIRPFLVPVVQPVQPSENHPQRQARAEQHELPLRDDGVHRCRRTNNPLRDDERRHEPDDVCEEQQPPHEPAATRAPCRRPRGGKVGRCRYSLR
jgi:hypothetical protein